MGPENNDRLHEEILVVEAKLAEATAAAKDSAGLESRISSLEGEVYDLETELRAGEEREGEAKLRIAALVEENTNLKVGFLPRCCVPGWLAGWLAGWLSGLIPWLVGECGVAGGLFTALQARPTGPRGLFALCCCHQLVKPNLPLQSGGGIASGSHQFMALARNGQARFDAEKVHLDAATREVADLERMVALLKSRKVAENAQASRRRLDSDARYFEQVLLCLCAES